jgi:hypothetical protein
MPSYVATRDAMICAYPSLFLDEADVLHQLFFTNGNGYDWFHGELIEGRVNDGKLVMRTSLEKSVQKARAQDRQYVVQQITWDLGALLTDDFESIDFWKALLKAIDDGDDTTYVKLRHEQERKYRLSCIKNKKDSSRFLLPDGTIGSKLYPMCEYADILRVPDDVKPDWLAASKKALDWALGPTCRTTAEDRRWLKKAAKRLQGVSQLRATRSA